MCLHPLSYRQLPNEDEILARKVANSIERLIPDIVNAQFNPAESSLAQLLHQRGRDLESVLTLLYYTLDYLGTYVHSNTTYLHTVREVLFFRTDIGAELNESQVSSALISVEGMIKGILKIVYHEEYSCQFDDNILFNMINGEDRSKVPLKAINGKVGIVDKNDQLFFELAHCIRHYRNVIVHHADISMNPSLIPYCNINNSRSRTITYNIIIFICLLISYRYDEIYEAVRPYIAVPQEGQGTAATEHDYAAVARQIIAEKYIPALTQEHKTQLRNIYSLYGTPTDEAPRLLQVKVKEYYTEAEKKRMDPFGDEADPAGYERKLSPLSFLDEKAVHRLVFLGGPSGSGKSTMLSQMILKLIASWNKKTADDSGLLPVRINLADYADSNNGVPHYIHTKLCSGYNYLLTSSECDDLKRYVDDLISTGSLVVFLDGVNEVPHNLPGVIRQINSFARSADTCQFIVTSRIEEISHLMEDFDHFERYELCSLEERQIKEQIKNFTSSAGSRNPWETLWALISRAANLEKFSRNPMQLMLLLGLVDRDSADNLSALNKTTLYDRFIHQLVSCEYRKIKTQHPRYSFNLNMLRGLIDNALMHVAERMLRKRDVKLEVVDYISYLNGRQYGAEQEFSFIRLAENMGYMSRVGSQPSPDEAFQDTANTVPLSEDKREEYLTFAHDSWKEFYEAKYIVTQYIRLSRNEERQTPEEILVQKRELVSYFGADLNRQDLLTSCFEMMELYELEHTDTGSFIRKAGLACEFTMLLLQNGRDSRQLAPGRLDFLSGTDTLHWEGTPFPLPNPHLEKLAACTNTLNYLLPLPNSVNGNKMYRLHPRYIVERLIQNQLQLYRRVYPQGTCQMPVLCELFRCVAHSGSTRLIDFLFEPYWLRLWLLHAEDLSSFNRGTASGQPVPETAYPVRHNSQAGERYPLISALLNQVAQPCYLYKKLFDCVSMLRLMGFKNSANEGANVMIKLILQMTDPVRFQILEFLGTQQPGGRSKILKNYTLLTMDDTDLLHEEDFQTIRQFQVPGPILNKLLPMSDKENVLAILLHLIRDASLKTQLRIVRYLIFHQILPKSLRDYIWSMKRKGGTVPLSDYVVDLLPLHAIPLEYAHGNYDMDIYHYQQEQLPDTGDSVNYFVYRQDTHVLELATQHLRYDFTGKYIKLKSAADGRWMVLQVQGERNVVHFKYRVRIDNQDGQLLTNFGTIRYTDATGKQGCLRYLAVSKDQYGMTLQVYDPEEVALYQHFLAHAQVLNIGSHLCQVTAVERSDLPMNLHLLQIQEKFKVPLYKGMCWVYLTSSCEQPQYVDKSSQVNDRQRPELFRPLLDDLPENKDFLSYAVFSQRFSQSLVLSTEDVENRLQGKYCRLDGMDQWFLVDDKTVFSGEFAEITLSGNAVDVPVSGSLQLSFDASEGEGEEEWNHLPYVYSVRRGQNYVMRIEDNDWVVWLKDPKVIALFRQNDTVKVRKQGLTFISAEIHPYSSASSRLSLHAVSDVPDDRKSVPFRSAVPGEGRLRFYADKRQEDGPLLLDTSAMCRRRKGHRLSHLHFFGTDGSKAFFLYPEKINLPHTVFLRLEDHLDLHPIVATTPIAELYQVSFTVSRPLPDGYELNAPSLGEAAVRYHLETYDAESGRATVWLCFPGKERNEGGREAMREAVEKITELTVGGEHYAISDLTIDADLSGKWRHLISTGEWERPADFRSSYAHADLEYYQPLNNSTKPGEFDNVSAHFFEVKAVRYRYVQCGGQDFLAIPRSSFNISALYYSIKGAKEYYRVRECPSTTVDQHLLGGVPYFRLALPPMASFNPHADRMGTVSFFYDQEGKNMAKIPFDHLLSLIDLDHPEKYHASVCQQLLEDCRDLGYLANEKLYAFFEAKNCAYEYLQYYFQLPVHRKNSHEPFQPSIGRVIAKDSVNTLVFRPKYVNYYDNENFSTNSGFLYSECDNSSIKVGDFVVCERNDRLTPLPHVVNDALLGFLEGVIIKVTAEGDVFIRVSSCARDFYTNTSLYPDVELRVGDKVSFFPSVNLSTRYSGQSMAVQLQVIENMVSVGVIERVDLVEMADRNGPSIHKLYCRIYDAEKGVRCQATFTHLAQNPHPFSDLPQAFVKGRSVRYFLLKENDPANPQQTAFIYFEN